MSPCQICGRYPVLKHDLRYWMYFCPECDQWRMRYSLEDGSKGERSALRAWERKVRDYYKEARRHP